MQNSYINTSKSTNSPSSNSESRIRRLFNGVTSTPLSSPTSRVKSSLFLPNKLSPLRSPPLYSLSEVPSSSNKPPRSVQNVSGPLLASTRFNVSLGTYTDTKSPGLANRIVQYSNEAKEKQIPTHQIKYGSPGLFPIVHFFKKDIPTISPKSRKVTVKIASPDTSWYNSPGYGSKKVGNQSQNLQNGHNVTQITADTETRSVLDALKEISRKRIHTSTDFETDQDICKRQKRCEKSLNSPDSNKRSREDSPVSDSPSKNALQPSAKKVCVVDLLAASFTSARMLKKGLKKKAELELENTSSKQTKLLTVATQTIEAVKPKEVKVTVEEKGSKVSDEQETEKHKKISSKTEEKYRYANIFDDRRLEVNRKNKLAALLSAISGESPSFMPYEKPNITDSTTLRPEIERVTASPSKLISILSPQNKPKHDKHVTFNLPPEKSDSTDKTSASVKELFTTNAVTSTSSSMSINTPTKDNLTTLNITTASETPKSALAVPVVTKLDFDMNNSSTVRKEETRSDIFNRSTEDAKKTETSGFFVEPAKQINSTSASAFPLSTESTISANTVSPIAATSINTPQSFTLSTDVSPKTGGFKFDLHKSPTSKSLSSTAVTSTTSINTTIPKFSFGTSEQTPSESNIPQTTLPMFNSPQATTSAAPMFPFGGNKATSENAISTPGLFSIANTNNTAKTATTSSAMMSFGSPIIGGNNNVNQTGLPPVSALQTTPISNSKTLNWQISSSNSPNLEQKNLSFNQTPQISNTTFTTQPSSQAISSAFGRNSPALASLSTFGNETAAPLSNSTLGSNAMATSTSSFSSSTFSTTPNFATTTSATPGFGTASGFNNMISTNTNTAGFGIPKTTSSFATSTATPMFGTSANPSFTAAPAFGSNTSVVPTFGSPAPNVNTIASSLFVANPTTQSCNTSTSSPGSFGSNLANKPFTFGSNNTSVGSTAFNVATTKPGFNFTPAVTSTNATSKSVPSFGAAFPASNVFGTTTVQSSTSTVNTSNIFKSPTSNFGSTNTQFGSKPAENTFGTKSENTFGAKSENTFGTKSENAFGTQSENTFGSFNNSFGTANTAPSFGTNINTANSFGAVPTTNAFGAAPNNTSTFGTAPNNTSTFGTAPNNTSSFGTAPNNTSTFGTAPNNTSFGTTPNNTSSFGTAPNNASTFGTASNNTSTFGTAPNSTSTFGTAPNSTSTFGTSNNPSSTFGATSNNNHAFGVSSNVTAGFGTNQTSGGVFGTTSSAGNTTFGSNPGNTNFGGGNVFGNTNTDATTFGFNSGDSAFAKPQASATLFGSTGSGDTTFQFRNNANQAFGAGNTTIATSAGQSNVFAFGGSNAPATPAAGVFAFGSPEAKPSFNFNVGSNAAPTFGASGFNAPSTTNFNPTPYGVNPMTAVFNIGSGSSSGRSRPAAKTKRRT